MKQHSKAPWILEGNYIRSSDVHEIGPIAAVNMDNMKFAPNSDLLLAAPALVAALRELTEWAALRSDWAQNGRAGEEPAGHPIAKARAALQQVEE